MSFYRTIGPLVLVMLLILFAIFVSVMGLQNVLMALGGSRKGGAVPYRDSKLTRYLQVNTVFFYHVLIFNFLHIDIDLLDSILFIHFQFFFHYF